MAELEAQEALGKGGGGEGVSARASAALLAFSQDLGGAQAAEAIDLDTTFVIPGAFGALVASRCRERCRARQHPRAQLLCSCNFGRALVCPGCAVGDVCSAHVHAPLAAPPYADTTSTRSFLSMCRAQEGGI